MAHAMPGHILDHYAEGEVGTVSLSESQQAVRDFHRVMVGDHVAPESPIDIEQYNGELRCALIEEEAGEFRSAWEARDRLGMIDALCDLLYVTLGAAVQMGVDLDPFFHEVHRANMAKGEGPLRADGKKLKPPGWVPPRIAETFARLYPLSRASEHDGSH
jgi:predicted HAD superfamily Cof-like phosphohydrolase